MHFVIQQRGHLLFLDKGPQYLIYNKSKFSLHITQNYMQLKWKIIAFRAAMKNQQTLIKTITFPVYIISAYKWTYH